MLRDAFHERFVRELMKDPEAGAAYRRARGRDRLALPTDLDEAAALLLRDDIEARLIELMEDERRPRDVLRDEILSHAVAVLTTKVSDFEVTDPDGTTRLSLDHVSSFDMAAVLGVETRKAVVPNEGAECPTETTTITRIGLPGRRAKAKARHTLRRLYADLATLSEDEFEAKLLKLRDKLTKDSVP